MRGATTYGFYRNNKTLILELHESSITHLNWAFENFRLTILRYSVGSERLGRVTQCIPTKAASFMLIFLTQVMPESVFHQE